MVQAGEFMRDDDPGTAAAIGQDVRALRKTKSLTLAELALKIGRSVGYVSQVERGLSEISIVDLKKIAAALDVPLSWFFVHEGVPGQERGRIVRKGERRKLGSTESGLVEELLSPDLGGAFEMFRSVFEPGAELTEPNLRATEEAGYVVEGALDVWLDGQWFRLEAGDSFRIDHEAHKWRNPGTARAVVIWVISPPAY